MKYFPYKLPLKLDQIIQKKQLQHCSLKESIAQNIHLVICTYRGESAYSEEFGCSVWDEEFNIQFNLRWKENLCESLERAINLYEKRLHLKEVKASMEERMEMLENDRPRARRCLYIEIEGIIKKTNEAFNFMDVIFISPLSQK